MQLSVLVLTTVLVFHQDDLRKARKYAEDLQRNKHKMKIVNIFLHIILCLRAEHY